MLSLDLQCAMQTEQLNELVLQDCLLSN